MKMIKKYITVLGLFITSSITADTITDKNHTTKAPEAKIYKIASRLPNLYIALTHKKPINTVGDPILFLHGASFPSALAADFKMAGGSWMDQLVANQRDVYALDFLGYGHSDRYPEMLMEVGTPPGRAVDIVLDVDRAVQFILKTTKKSKVHIIAHSWGGTVAALYTGKYPDRVAKLVLLATITKNSTSTQDSKTEHLDNTYMELTTAQRIADMHKLVPAGKPSVLAPEVDETWGQAWLDSDRLHAYAHPGKVRFPSGFQQDVIDLFAGNTYYDPRLIKSPVLLVRGEWDEYPSDAETKQLQKSLTQSAEVKYVILKESTHVPHLEKSRFKLYTEVFNFLK